MSATPVLGTIERICVHTRRTSTTGNQRTEEFSSSKPRNACEKETHVASVPQTIACVTSIFCFCICILASAHAFASHLVSMELEEKPMSQRKYKYKYKYKKYLCGMWFPFTTNPCPSLTRRSRSIRPLAAAALLGFGPLGRVAHACRVRYPGGVNVATGSDQPHGGLPYAGRSCCHTGVPKSTFSTPEPQCHDTGQTSNKLLAQWVGASIKSRSGVLEARHYASNCLE